MVTLPLWLGWVLEKKKVISWMSVHLCGIKVILRKDCVCLWWVTCRAEPTEHKWCSTECVEKTPVQASRVCVYLFTAVFSLESIVSKWRYSVNNEWDLGTNCFQKTIQVRLCTASFRVSNIHVLPSTAVSQQSVGCLRGAYLSSIR